MAGKGKPGPMSKAERSRIERARKAGRAVVAKYGREHMARIGKLGGGRKAPRLPDEYTRCRHCGAIKPA